MRGRVKGSKTTNPRRHVSGRFARLQRRSLRFEALEERQLLAITVNTLVDENNGIGVGGISLRDAIAAAASGDTINFAPALFSSGARTSQLLHGALAVDKSLTINGPGQDLLTIDGSQNQAVTDSGGIFLVSSSDSTVSNVILNGLTLSGGHISYFGGAIYNDQNLTITGCMFTQNSAQFGGAIYSSGTLSITNSNFLNNIASSHGGGIEAVGSLTLQTTVVSGNSSFNGFGGGIVSYANTTISTSNIVNNSAKTTGGGIQSLYGELSIAASTITGNSAGDVGGGAYIKSVAGIATNYITIQNSTISGNTAGTAAGVFALNGNVTFLQATIAENHATIAGGVELIQPNLAAFHHSTVANNTSTQFGGGIAVLGGGLTLDGTIVAKNTGPFGADIAALFSAIVTPTYSLIGDNNGSGLTDNQGTPDANGNLIGGGISHSPLDPHLSQLSGHGGATPNYVPLPGSIAIDHGNPAAVAGSGFVQTTDQRLSPYARVANGRIDIGAIETQSLSPLNFVVDTLADESDGNYSAGHLSLREATELANQRQNSIDTISFAPSLTASGPASIVLTLGQLVLSDSVSINGPTGNNKLTIDASGNDPTPNIDDGGGTRVLQIAPEDTLLSAAVTISNLTLTGGDTGSFLGGGAIAVQGKLTLNNCTLTGNYADSIGGAIAVNDGTLTLSSTKISGNTSNSTGGGIYLLGDAMINGSTLSGNKAQNGGGAIYATKTFERSSQLSITSSTIENNTASIGGGIDADGFAAFFGQTLLSVSVFQSTISGNIANGAAGQGRGGGIYSEKATMQISTSTISGNTSTSAGAGLAFYDTNATIGNSTITKNSAQTMASGIHVDFAGHTQVNIQSSIVAGNIGVNRDFDSTSPSSIKSLGYNLIGPGVTSSFTATGDQVTSDAKLGPLADNGGPTKTHALLTGSPAIDLGDPTAVAGVGGVSLNDQRGAPYTRVYNGDNIGGARIDIGAFELQPLQLTSSADYNHSGRVDAADYVVWRNTLGTTGVTPFSGADGDGDGTIGPFDFNVWRSHFGNAAAAGSGQSSDLASSSATVELESFEPADNSGQAAEEISTTVAVIGVVATPMRSGYAAEHGVTRQGFGHSSQLSLQHSDTALLDWVEQNGVGTRASRRRVASSGVEFCDEASKSSGAAEADGALDALFASVGKWGDEI